MDLCFVADVAIHDVLAGKNNVFGYGFDRENLVQLEVDKRFTILGWLYK